MERTRENLSRVNDILREIERQTQYLERQAKKAEVYKRLVEELRELELRVAGRQWRGLQWELAELDETPRPRWPPTIERLRAELAANQQRARAGGGGTAVAAPSSAMPRAREQLAVLEAERAQRAPAHRDAESSSATSASAAARGSAEDAEATRVAQRDAAAERLRQAEREREASAQYLLFDEGELRASRGRARRGARGAGARCRRRSRRRRARWSITSRARSRRATRRAALERRREDIARQLDKLRGEEATLEQRRGEIDAQLVARRADLERLRGELADATGAQEARTNELRALAEARRRWERAGGGARGGAAAGALAARVARADPVQLRRLPSRRARDHARRAACRRRARRRRRRDRHPAGVRARRRGGARRSPAVRHRARRGQMARSRSTACARRRPGAAASFRCSRACPISPRVAKLNGTSRRLLDLVRVDDQYRGVAQSLLGEVVLVPDLHSAIALWRRTAIRVTLVTPEGDVIDPCGVITGGSDRPIEEEILARRREIDQLRSTRRDAAARSSTEVRARARSGRRWRSTAAEEAVQALGAGRARAHGADRRGREGHRAPGDRAAAVLQPARRGALRDRQPASARRRRRSGRGASGCARADGARRAAPGARAGAWSSARGRS